MIKKYSGNDLDSVIKIWLAASIKAHSFVPEDFWRSQIGNMREIYIPASETYVYELDSEVVGFYALYENNLAAIFVKPELQGKGIGKQLINHAKTLRQTINLNVYKENQASYDFYRSQGFKLVNEQTDPHTGHQEFTLSFNG